jgi:hypothetical protein
MWIVHQQQQQRGAQLHARGRRQGDAPEEATRDRAAQDHDYADLDVSGGEPARDIDYPASAPANRKGDITPTAPEAEVEWDEVVQPEKAETRDFDDQPLPEGK